MTEQATIPAIPVATVILLRDVPDGMETLLLRRNAKLAFHGGAWVFPGGRIDPEDYPANTPNDTMAAACHAAVREAAEEAWLALRPADLVMLSHWTTPKGRPHRYATWFFVAAAGKEAVQVDRNEIHAHRWMRPAHALTAHGRRDIELPPPTFMTLLKLAEYSSVSEALAAIAAQTPETYLPRFCKVPGGACTLYAGDAGYSTGDADHPGPRHRLWMLDSGWRYEQTR